MSFAVIQTGGKQYKVSTSEILKIERLKDQVGKTVAFKDVLFLNDGKNTEIGNPIIKGAKVEATILKNTKNKTILVFKKRRRKNSRKKYGHRQQISLIKITKIFSKEGKLIDESELKKEKTQVKAERPKKEKTPIKVEKPKVELTRKMKADKERRLQQEEARKFDKEEKLRLEEVQKRIKIQVKKSGSVKKKKTGKKKTLTTKKK